MSMQPDAVQRRNKPFECRVILLGALYISKHKFIGYCNDEIPQRAQSKEAHFARTDNLFVLTPFFKSSPEVVIKLC